VTHLGQLEQDIRRTDLYNEKTLIFNRSPMNKPFDPANQDLIIGEGVTFTGTIAAPGKAIISGAVSGSIAAQDLLVEKAGTITGKVRAIGYRASCIVLDEMIGLRCHVLLAPMTQWFIA
jgi:hypothetical protein